MGAEGLSPPPHFNHWDRSCPKTNGLRPHHWLLTPVCVTVDAQLTRRSDSRVRSRFKLVQSKIHSSEPSETKKSRSSRSQGYFLPSVTERISSKTVVTRRLSLAQQSYRFKTRWTFLVDLICDDYIKSVLEKIRRIFYGSSMMKTNKEDRVRL